MKAGRSPLPRVADNTVWSHWQVASRSSEVNFTKNYTLLYLFYHNFGFVITIAYTKTVIANHYSFTYYILTNLCSHYCLLSRGHWNGQVFAVCVIVNGWHIYCISTHVPCPVRSRWVVVRWWQWTTQNAPTRPDIDKRAESALIEVSKLQKANAARRLHCILLFAIGEPTTSVVRSSNVDAAPRDV